MADTTCESYLGIFVEEVKEVTTILMGWPIIFWDLQRTLSECERVNNNNNIYLTAIGLLPGGSGCIHAHIYEKGAVKILNPLKSNVKIYKPVMYRYKDSVRTLQ